MTDDKNRINIMTSCDDNLTNYIFVQLRTIAMHLKNKEIHFFLFYNRIPIEKLDKLAFYCRCLGNITFHEIFIEDEEPYIELAKKGFGSLYKKGSIASWPYEAYFPFECYKYLPDDVDRILYIDAGDVIFMGEIDEFYFEDFDGKSLIVVPGYVKHDWSYFTSKDLSDNEHLENIKKGIFNSGSYMMNIDIMRKENISMDKILDVVKVIEDISSTDMNYFGDQGLLSIVFINKMKYFQHEVKDLGYTPYNFTLTYFRSDVIGGDDRELWYEPKIVHLVDGTPKPWNLVERILVEGLIEPGKTVSIREAMEMAAKTKNGIVKIRDGKKYERTIIETGMIPFFEYWFVINEEVKKDLEKIFSKGNDCNS